MKFILTTCFTILCATIVMAQSPADYWQKVQPDQIWLPETAETVTLPQQYQTLSLDFASMRHLLQTAPSEGSPAAKSGQVQIKLPMPDGNMETFRVWESSIMAPELAAKFPMIKTFAGRGIEDPTHTVRLGYGLDGFHAVILSENGGSVVAPYAINQTQYYICFSKADFTWEGLDLPPTMIQFDPFEDETTTTPDNSSHNQDEELSFRGGGDGALTELRMYRFALACTGEYGSTHGGTVESVLSTLVTAANALNGVLERDADMRLVLIANNDLLVFLDPNSDPYQNSNMGTALLGQNEDILNTIVGLPSFDVGHVFTNGCTDVGGVVSGSVCSGGKARGVTCHFSNNVVATTLSIAAHEMGHQFAAGHTFNNCPGQDGQFASGSAWEPGSGSTLLSYQGSCGSNNINGPAGVYYHGGTIGQFWFYTHLAGGNICPNIVQTSNHSPLVELPYEDGFFIPIRTPFELEANASDADGDPLKYCWEQYDLGPSSQLGMPVGTAPLFRSYDPVDSPLRTFPRLPILLNTSSEITEVLPTYSRVITFRCTVRDYNVDEGAAGVTWQDVQFRSTDTAGPFLVTSPNTAAAVWTAGSETEVAWNVANTDNDLVKCKAVNIKLSMDGGYTYPYTLAYATPNDGSETISVPDVQGNMARVRVEAANNIFFDISNQNFQIAPAAGPTFSLAISPQLQQVCVPQSAVMELITGAIQDFNTPVEFEILGGLPAGVGVDFSTNPVAPGSSSTLTFDMTDVTADGEFEVELRGIAGTDTLYRTLHFNVVYNDFSDMLLTGPDDGQSSLGLLPSFDWTDVPQADLYDYQLSTSATFAPGTIIDEAFNLTDAAYTPDVALTESQIYFWRLRAKNECGPSDWTLARTFQTYTVSCAPFVSNDVPKAISAVGLPVVESELIILQNGIISDLNVGNIKGNHDALADLKVSLISPAGTEVVLFENICGNVSTFNFGLNDEAPFAIACPPLNGLAYKPQSPLSAFVGENTLGSWKLKVAVINTLGQGGALSDWDLEFCASVSANNPFVVKNDPLFVQPGQSNVLYNGKLLVEDSDNGPNDLTFTIVDGPESGFLMRDGVQLAVGDHFTMGDIHAWKIQYQNTDATATDDFFTFVVEDGTGGWLGTPKFNIQIDPNATVDVDENTFANSINVFPNPASDLLNISFSQMLDKEANVFISNLAGQRVATQRLAAGQGLLQVDISSYAAGVYFLNVVTDGGAFAKKFIVE